MRVLHTADWHVGKKLGRIDRFEECAAVLDELVETTRREDVDLVIVAGDLFDRALPAFSSLGLVLSTLERLAQTGARVVAVAGNHDSSELFGVLAPYLEPVGVTLIHKALRPAEGGVVRVESRDGTERAQVACFPFLHETTFVDFLGIPAEEWFKSYAQRVRDVAAHYARWMEDNDPSAINILAGHYMISGARPSGSERELHIGDAYMAPPSAVPAGVDYTALGHIHRCQQAPSAAGEAWYPGSLMQLDFGEAGEEKCCLLVDITHNRTRVAERIPVTAGRSLLKVTDTLDNLRARAKEVAGAYLDVGVLTEGPEPGLADEVRSFLPDALHVRAVYERAAGEEVRREGLPLEELYALYVRHAHGVEPSGDLLAAFRELRDEHGLGLASPQSHMGVGV